MARALGIGGAFMKSANPEQLADWYVSVLGLGAHRHNSLTGSFGLSFDPKQLPSNAYVAWSITSKDTKHYTSEFMFNFIVDEIDGVLARIDEAGGEILRRGFVLDGVGTFAWFKDPEGNQMELWQPMSD